MRAHLLATALLCGLVAACSTERDTDAISQASAPAKRAGVVAFPGIRGASSVASLPDRGELLAYDKGAATIRSGATTWHAVTLSEAHALNAVASGHMTIPGPDGHPIRLAYDRHVESLDGNWTFIGHVEGGKPGQQAVLTFGEKAVFGSIPNGDRLPLQVTMTNGRSWLVETDGSRLKTTGADIAPTEEDVLSPEMITRAVTAKRASIKTAAASSSESLRAESLTAQTVTVDLVLGYTSGFADRLGGTSAAVTRLSNMVAIANTAFVNSQLDAQLRLVSTIQVGYADNTSNRSALFDLTGVTCTNVQNGGELPDGGVACTYVGTPAALQPLLTTRNALGADLVALVRKLEFPENGSCGVAWLLGHGGTAIDANASQIGLAIVSDSSGGQFPDEGNTCRSSTLAHELGHNMGLQHDRTTAAGNDDTNNDGNLLDPEEFGHFPYAFGMSTDVGAGNFNTIMGTRRTGQATFDIFSNPRTTFCGGFACGIVDEADNARALASTLPIIASFRNPTSTNDIFTIAKMGASGTTEVHTLGGSSAYGMFSGHWASVLHRTGSDFAWRYILGDYNRDGIKDMYVIAKNGASNTTEVHVLNGANGFATYLTHVATPLPQTGADQAWQYRLGDFNKDGFQDIYAITRVGAAGTEVHVLNGATNYTTWLAHSATPVAATGGTNTWNFLLGDYNHDGTDDVYMIVRSNTGSNSTEVHVLNGTNFNSWLLNTGTVLPQVGAGGEWDFDLADYNGDGNLDLYVFYKLGASGTTEAHIMDGSTAFQGYSAHIATGLHTTGADNAWEFEVGRF